MKIYKKLHKAIEETMEKYNEYVPEDRMVDWTAYITAAIDSSLNDKHADDGDDKNKKGTDWSKAEHLNCLQNSFEIVKVFPDKSIYHQIMSKVSNNEDITFDDAMCFVVKNYLIKFELMTKKAQLDATWDADNVLIALHSCGQLTEFTGYAKDGKGITMTCPKCEHPDFAIYFESGSLHCFSGSCKYVKGSGHDIWDLLSSGSKSFAAVVETVYAAVVTNHSASKDLIDGIEAAKKRYRKKSSGGSHYNVNVDKIIAVLTPDLDAMYQFGYTKKTLLECDCVGYRDLSVVKRCNESNDFRGRICWAIKDVSGNIVGLQGRSIFGDAARRDLVQTDSWILNTYHGDKGKISKLMAKAMFTAESGKSDHLYLLYKYVQQPEQYRAVVVTEGIKDAMRIYQQHIPDIAVVSSFGCELSSRQIELLKIVFGTSVQIKLAYDGDSAGYQGSIKAAKDLAEAGFGDIKFVVYEKKNSSEYYKDFGEVFTRHLPTTAEKIYRMLKGVRLDKYIEEITARGFTQTQAVVSQKTVEKKLVVVEKTTDDISEKVKQSIIEMLRAKKRAAVGKITDV